MEAPKEDSLGFLGPLPLHILRPPPPSRGRTFDPKLGVTSFTLGGKVLGQFSGSGPEFLPFSLSDQRSGAGPEGFISRWENAGRRGRPGEGVWKQGSVFREPAMPSYVPTHTQNSQR